MWVLDVPRGVLYSKDPLLVPLGTRRWFPIPDVDEKGGEPWSRPFRRSLLFTFLIPMEVTPVVFI